MHLVIVESPNKCAKIQSILGSGYQVAASCGHVRDLPEAGGLGIDLGDGRVIPRYEVTDRAQAAVAKLRRLSREADEVSLATDPDREGEAIAWHLVETLGLRPGGYQRVVFHSITEAAIRDGMSNPRSLAMPLVDAQQARRCIDRCVGWLASAVCRNGMGSGSGATSAGRVQSPAVRLVVERDAAIARFAPTAYVEVQATLRSGDPLGRPWLATLCSWGGVPVVSPSDPGADVDDAVHDQDGAEVGGRSDASRPTLSLTDREVVRSMVERCRQAVWSIKSVRSSDRSVNPPPPFTTSTMQQAASVELGMSPEDAMRVAQSLFAAGLITYHRTDSPSISEEGIADLRAAVASVGQDLLPTEPRRYHAGSASAQEAHEAIRPTHADHREAGATDDERRLYRLIWLRAVASQMVSGVDRVQVVLCVADQGVFRARGITRVAPGWRTLVGNGEASPRADGPVLPPIETADPVVCDRIDGVAKATRPPKRYTEASLVADLERRGIGRPATFAAIMATIKARGYVERNGRFLVASQRGAELIRFLTTCYAGDFVDYDYTASIEAKLDQVAEGKSPWIPLVRGAVDALRVQTEAAGFQGAISGLLTGEGDRSAVAPRAPVLIPADAIRRACRDCGAEIALWQQEGAGRTGWVVVEVVAGQQDHGVPHRCQRPDAKRRRPIRRGGR